LERFCRDAAASGALIVIPRTTLLEDQRHQRRLVEEGVAALDGAIALLERYGIHNYDVDSRSLVSTGDLVSALRATGIQVELVDPTLEDYRNAEERAALRLPPHPPAIKSDEMRDLVIWAVALRIAKRDGKAILISRDEVHMHERGNGEATDSGLLRARTVDEALVFVGRESPAGALSQEILSSVWDAMRGAGLPLPIAPTSAHVDRLQFVTDVDGYITGTLHFMVTTDAGDLEADLEVTQVSGKVIQADLDAIRLSGHSFSPSSLTVTAVGYLPRTADEDDGMSELREMIEGQA